MCVPPPATPRTSRRDGGSAGRARADHCDVAAGAASGPDGAVSCSVRAVDVDGADDGGGGSSARGSRPSSVHAGADSRDSAGSSACDMRSVCESSSRSRAAPTPLSAEWRLRRAGVGPRAEQAARLDLAAQLVEGGGARRLGEEREHELVDLAVVGERRGRRHLGASEVSVKRAVVTTRSSTRSRLRRSDLQRAAKGARLSLAIATHAQKSTRQRGATPRRRSSAAPPDE